MALLDISGIRAYASYRLENFEDLGLTNLEVFIVYF
jgi:hypothetical protein